MGRRVGKAAAPPPIASTIRESASGFEVQYPFQRKGFFTSPLLLQFYVLSNLIQYSFTSDLTTWSIGGWNRSCIYSRDFSVVYDGVRLHYCYAPETNSTALFYRRGVPLPDGSIDWEGIGEQTANPAVVNTRHLYPAIAVDSDGYPWIGYHYCGVGQYPNGTPYVTRSNRNDGVWQTDAAAGFPYQLHTTVTNWAVAPVALTGGKVYVLYDRFAAELLGILYDAGWGGQAQAHAAHHWVYGWSCQGYGDDVLVLLQSGVNSLFRRRTSGAWQGAETVLPGLASSTTVPNISLEPASGNVWAIQGRPDKKFWNQKRTAGGWGAANNWWTDPYVIRDPQDMQQMIALPRHDTKRTGICFRTYQAAPVLYRLRMGLFSI